jgi:hypothetical protein
LLTLLCRGDGLHVTSSRKGAPFVEPVPT